MDVRIKSFTELNPLELYQVLQLRQDVFVIEQQCIYPDLDDKDLQCTHVLLVHEGVLAAYSRLVPPGISYPEPSIGRVCTRRSLRMEGLGIQLMHESMQAVSRLWPGMDICISAQAYLEKFYMKFGFQTMSQPYMEDDIPHIKMVCRRHE